MRPYTYTYNVMCVYKPAASCSDQGAQLPPPPGGHTGHLAPGKSRNGYHCPRPVDNILYRREMLPPTPTE